MDLFKNVPEIFIEFLEENRSTVGDNISVLQEKFAWFSSPIWQSQQGGSFNLTGGGTWGDFTQSVMSIPSKAVNAGFNNVRGTFEKL